MELDLEGYCGKHKDPGLAKSETKYFPPGPGRRKAITRQYLARSAAKQARKNGAQDSTFPAPYDRHLVPITGCRVASDIRFRDDRPRSPQHQRGWQHEVREGRDLARSRVPLPYSGEGPIRRPTLEREEAFWDPTTCKRLKTSMADSTVSVVSDDVDPDTAQLYQIGLLYDDEYQRGSGFNLNTIVHDEPAYTLRFAKRQHKVKTTSGYQLGLPQTGLPLNLSFARLYNDDTIAQFLISPSPSETHPDWEAASIFNSEAIASVHSLTTSYEEDVPAGFHDTQMTDAVPDLIQDCFDEPATTQVPEFDCDSDTTSLSGSDADLVILPLHMSPEEDERIRQTTTPPRRHSIPTFDDATASWIMLGDDS